MQIHNHHYHCIFVSPLDPTHTCRLKEGYKIVCTLIALLGFVFFDVVYIVSVMNYAAQSELNIHLLQATTARVKQKIDYPDINTAIKVCV